MYAKKDLVILDDVFSGLDAETEEQVFSRLLSKQGLFNQMKTTVIIATHAVSRLSYSNYIIALNSAGHVAEQGSFNELNTSGGYVQGLDTRLKNEDSSKLDGQEFETPKNTQIFSNAEEDFDAQAEELNRQTGDFQVYKYYFASIGWLDSCIFICFCTIYGTSSKLTEFLLIYCKSNLYFDSI